MALRLNLSGTIDRAVGFFSPAAGLDRMKARRQMSVMMNYDAASRGPRTASWRGPASSADAAGQSMGARARLRNVARDFVRNRPYAARGISVITGNVVGNGIHASVAEKNLASDADAEKVLSHMNSTSLDAGGVLNFAAMQRVIMNAVVEDGEVLLRRRWRKGIYAKGLKLPFQIELLEADYLDPRVNSHGGNEVIDGIEIGPTGAVVAYHLFKRHPGSASRRIDLESVRVPASDIIHVRRIDRPGQLRGVSWFAPIMLTLGDLSDYQEAEIVKQKMAALTAGFIESDDEVGPGQGAASPALEAEDLGIGEMVPGALLDLPPGKRVSFNNPPTVNGYDGFFRQNLGACAMGLGITYESMAGDLSNTNFVSGKMGRIDMDRNIENWQTHIVIDQVCKGVGGWANEARALLPSAGDAPVLLTWTAPRRPLIDPREVKALISEVDAGLNSRSRATRQLGRDPDLIHEERIKDAERDKELPRDTKET